LRCYQKPVFFNVKNAAMKARPPTGISQPRKLRYLPLMNISENNHCQSIYTARRCGYNRKPNFRNFSFNKRVRFVLLLFYQKTGSFKVKNAIMQGLTPSDAIKKGG
jgi:hypothetical protein